ncbi:hypothetical protein EVAR_69714_1 [Eumeta japonica]|uniref:Uncharacterized protein n=1 Tax=Eumeta variegata TaxID=151549 RepID=A0A4C1TA47_EUMVA|nr:hypothetical protein EVAR_69714_1 [Eumeta japonica]
MDDMSSEEIIESRTQKPTNRDEEKMRTNRMKREISAEDASASALLESKQLDSHEQAKTASKRQTALTGNAKRLQNLVNLPIQIDVLANVLSKLSTGILDAKSKSATSNSISGNDGSGSGLVNIPIDVDAVVNVLSNINTDSGSGSSRGGLVDGLWVVYWVVVVVVVVVAQVACWAAFGRW